MCDCECVIVLPQPTRSALLRKPTRHGPHTPCCAVGRRRTSAFDLTLKSLRPSSAKHHISPEHAAAFLKEVDLDIFMQRLLDV